MPGYEGEISTENEAIKIVEEIGYPVIIKASAGGGGRGMRVVNSSDELWQSIQSAQNEAELAFGDGKIFIEKYLK